MSEDRELLSRYLEEQSEAAFAELVRRHVNLVHSAAVRLAAGDAHRAQDITQQVFIQLVRKAASLKHHPTLTGWLYAATRLIALRQFRTESRRKAREQEACRMNQLQADSQPDWARLEPVLDEAMHGLSDNDRLAVLLRFFENKPLRDVGAALGLNENSARMRVDRALGKLRAQLERRGIRSTSTALATVLAAHAVTAAPAPLVATLASTSVAAAAVGTAGLSIFSLSNMTTIKITSLVAAIAAGLGTPLIIQHQAQTKLRAENQALRLQLEPLAPLQEETARLSNLVARIDTASLERQSSELLQLRAEVSALRRQTNELAQLRRQNSQMEQRLAAVSPAPNQATVANDPLSALRQAKVLAFTMMKFALRNQDQFPTSLHQTAAFLEESFRSSLNPGETMPDPESFFQATNQFEITLTGSISGITNPASTILLRERQARQLPDGKWVKAYAFADGHAQVHIEPDGDFARYEAEHMAPPR